MTEPSRFIVLGDGFVTSVLKQMTAGCRSSSYTNCFTGDFGTAVVNEVEGHNSLSNPLDLDAAKWTSNANPEIGNLTGGTGLEPHLTVRGSGNGASDFYKFTVGAGARAQFDIDHGYEGGDSVLWISLLKLYDSTGKLIAQGPG